MTSSRKVSVGTRATCETVSRRLADRQDLSLTTATTQQGPRMIEPYTAVGIIPKSARSKRERTSPPI